MSIEDKLTQRAVDAGGRLRVKSALNPILWLCGIITIPSISVIAYLGGNLRDRPLIFCAIAASQLLAVIN